MKLVFLSQPNWFPPEYKRGLDNFVKFLRARDLDPRSIGITDQPTESPMDEVIQLMEQCSGSIVLGIPQIEVLQGRLKSNEIIPPLYLGTEWNHIEAALAHSLGLPVLVIHDARVVRGVFDPGAMNTFLHRVEFADESWALTEPIPGAIAKWSERLRSPTSANRRGGLPEPTLQWGCYHFEGKQGLYCPSCYENKGQLIPVPRLAGGHYKCPSCAAQLS